MYRRQEECTRLSGQEKILKYVGKKKKYILQQNRLRKTTNSKKKEEKKKRTQDSFIIEEISGTVKLALEGQKTGDTWEGGRKKVSG